MRSKKRAGNSSIFQFQSHLSRYKKYLSVVIFEYALCIRRNFGFWNFGIRALKLIYLCPKS